MSNCVNLQTWDDNNNMFSNKSRPDHCAKNTDVTQCKRMYKQNAIKKKILKPVRVSTSNYPANVVPQANLQTQ